jgi:hypothetical protein
MMRGGVTVAKADWKILHTDVRLASAAHTRAEIDGVRTSWRTGRGHPAAEVRAALRSVKAFCAEVSVSVLVVRERVQP